MLRSVDEAERLSFVNDREVVAALVKVAREATNGWAICAKRKTELADIARLHAEISRLATVSEELRSSEFCCGYPVAISQDGAKRCVASGAVWR